jgi:transposase
MLQSLVRCTWAPKGQMPVCAAWPRHDRWSVLSALSVSPKRRRLGLYFDILDHNIATDDFETFILRVRQRLGRSIILVMDRYTVHKAAAQRFGDTMQVEWLPPYAPELNPVELVWNHTKHDDLANFLPDNLIELGHAVAPSIRNTRSQWSLLRAFFQHAGLDL